jgi:hypothetical protein
LSKSSHHCSHCGRGDVVVGLTLLDQTVTHHYRKTCDEEVYSQNMQIAQCQSCFLVQLATKFPLEKLTPFYPWITCTEPEAHLDGLVLMLLKLPGINESCRIQGLTFKEESTLDRFNKKGFYNTGTLDMKKDLNITNPNSKIELIQNRFNRNTAKKAAKKYGQSDIFIARHILEHAYDLGEFASASIDMVREGGYILFEIPDCEAGLRDGDPTILWEEHTVYFTEATFKNFLKNMGYPVIHFERVNYKYEDAFVAIIRKDPPKLEVIPNTLAKIEVQRFKKFSLQFNRNKSRFRNFLSRQRSEGKKIAIIGAGHMGNSFINYYDISDLIDYVMDDNPNMVGLYIPRCKKNIVSSEIMKTNFIHILLSSLSEQGEKMFRLKNKKELEGVEFMSIYPQDHDSVYAHDELLV